MRLENKLEQLPLIKSDKKLQKQLFGRDDLTPMWVADMDFQTDENIQNALIKRVENSGFAYEFQSEGFKKAQYEWYKKRYNIDLDQEQILYSPSIPTSIGLILDTFTEEGNGVILQTPVFFDFKHIIKRYDRKLISNSLLYNEGRYSIDFDDLEKKASDPNNKVLVFTNPHNPVGRVWSSEEVQKIIDIVKKYDLLLISDEIHKDVILYDNQFTSILSFNDKDLNSIVVTSEAKSFNLCSISDAMTIVNKTETKELLTKAFEKLNFGRPNALTAVAVETAYLKGEKWLENLKLQLEKNISIVENGLENSKIKLVHPEGTFLLWLDFSELYDNPKILLKEIVEKTGLALNSGHWFGREGAGFLRMNIATSEDKVYKAVEALKKLG